MSTFVKRFAASVAGAGALLAVSVVPGAADSSTGSAPEPPARPAVVLAASTTALPAGFLADCMRSGSPDAHGYATGSECPPPGFPYEPVVEMTKAGLRAMDPYDNGCSKSRDSGATFDFNDACATHDYLADLQRFGAPGVTEPGMDHQFLQDMKADCEGRNFVARRDCIATAYVYRAFVQQGNYSEGDHIDTGD